MKQFEMSDDWTEEEIREMRKEHFKNESNFLREKRSRANLNDLTILAKLGKGGYGEVYLCRKNDTGELMAVKILNKTRFVHKNEVHRAKMEREILTEITNSPRLVQLNYCFQTRDNLLMCMEYVPGGDLKHLLDNLGCLSEKDAKFYFAEMLLSVHALHELGYIHRDLKPDNFMIDKRGHLKLIDFGLSKEGWDDKYSSTFKSSPARKTKNSANSKPDLLYNQKFSRSQGSIVGSPEYIAIEVLENQNYTRLADYWSLGVILYEMLTSYTPFIRGATTADDVFQNILNWDKKLEKPDHCIISEECWNLIIRLICDPEFRIGSVCGIQEIQNHNWFNDFDWDNIDDMNPPFIPKLENDTDTSYFSRVYDNEDCDSLSEIFDDSISVSSEKYFSDTSDLSLDLSQGTRYSDEKQFEWSGFTWRRSSYDPVSHLRQNSPRKSKRLSESDIFKVRSLGV